MIPPYVDIVGLYDNRMLFLIEVKDYRFYKRKKPVDPRIEFESKVRNTIAGLVGACRRREYKDACEPFARALLDLPDVKLVCWWEERAAGGDDTVADKRARAGASISMKLAKTYVKWMDVRVMVTRRLDDYESVVPGLKVPSLDRRRRRHAEDVIEKLEKRGFKVQDEDRQRILDCLEVETLTSWLERANLVNTVPELFARR